MPKLIWLLRFCGKAWIGLAILLMASHLFRDDPWKGEGVFLYSGTLALRAWFYAQRLERRLPLTRETADQLVREYGAAIEQRKSELPATKGRIKEALRFVARGAVHDKHRLGLLGAGYITLSDFQNQPTTSEARLSEMRTLSAEWEAWKQELKASSGDPCADSVVSRPLSTGSLEITPRETNESWPSLVFSYWGLELTCLFFMGIALGMASISWIGDRFFPQGTPLERCLKGHVPHEFLEEDQDKLRTLDRDTSKALDVMNARHEQQWDKSFLNSHSMTTHDEIFALSSAHIEEAMQFLKIKGKERETVCRNAATRVEF